MVLLRLFWVFLQVGVLGYGGGPGSLGLIESLCVQAGFVTPERFQEMLAVGFALPGPVATKMSGLIGYQTEGVLGLVVALAAEVLPSLVLMLVLFSFFLKFKDTPVGHGMFAGVAPAVLAILVVLVLGLVPGSVHNWIQGAFLVVAFVALRFLNVPVPVVIVASLIGGALFLRA